MIGIPVWNNRVSPVLDSAGQLLVVDFEDGSETSRRKIDLAEPFLAQKVRRICQAGIDTIICGAVSRHLEMMLTASGIEVIPWVRGEVNDILEAHLAGSLEREAFHLPGCFRRRERRGMGGRKGHRHGSGRGGGIYRR